jgi:glyoxylase-like metal-dependent hydrolase (beta-lactamase superfamily II)
MESGNLSDAIDAVTKLAPLERFVLVMSILERYSAWDCSLLLGCSIKNVAVARMRALRRLPERNANFPNEWLHSAGAAILAHENTRKHLSTTTRVEGWDFTFPPAPAGAIPTVVFGEEQTVQLNGATIALKHYPPAHTDSDISVHFTDADVFHTGDTWWNGYYPFIDYSTGGSIDGTIRAAEANLTKVTDKMIIIPGHGPVGDKSQLTVYRNPLVTVRNKVATLKKQGKSLDEIIAAKPTAAYDAKWGGGFMPPAFFTGLVFEGV